MLLLLVVYIEALQHISDKIGRIIYNIDPLLFVENLLAHLLLVKHTNLKWGINNSNNNNNNNNNNNKCSSLLLLCCINRLTANYR
jgi:hypothetical protein